MLLKEYATNKEAQRYLRMRCNLHAFNMRLQFSDLFSLAHTRIAEQINNGRELTDHVHLFNTLRYIAKNCALDLKTRAFNRHEGLTDPFELPEVRTFSHDFEAKEQLRLIDAGIRKRFIERPNVLAAYDGCIIDGRKYEEIAEELKIPIGTLKTNIWEVRQFANELRKSICS
jgi:hypothetical protein